MSSQTYTRVFEGEGVPRTASHAMTPSNDRILMIDKRHCLSFAVARSRLRAWLKTSDTCVQRYQLGLLKI